MSPGDWIVRISGWAFVALMALIALGILVETGLDLWEDVRFRWRRMRERSLARKARRR